MKKILLIFVALAFINCKDDDDEVIYNYIPTNDYQSSVTVDESDFKPSSGHYTIFNPDNEAETGRTFVLETGSDAPEKLEFNISFPKTMPNATGDYIFHIGEISENLFANGDFTGTSSWHHMAGGTVHVTELGNHKFRFEFEHIEAVDIINGLPDIIIEGIFEGTLAFNGTAN